jgi:hypothetical protein
MAGLGSLKKLTGALQAASEATRVEKPAQRMSEALNPHVGKRLYVTQADRTALDYDQGLLGGPGFVELATIDPNKYKDIAWAVGKPGIAKTIVNSMAQHPEEAIWSNIIGSPTQHKSNQVVFDRLMNKFHNAIQEDKLTPELHKTINDRLANMKDPDTGKALFPKDVDIAHPDFKEHAQTFNTRALISDILSGKGVGGEKGTIIDFPKEIAETTDPYLLHANTGDIGDRLFSLSGNIEHRPELHPAFPSALGGRKESEAFMPAPSELVLQDYIPTFHQKILDKNAKLGENKPLRDPTYYDLTRGYAPNVPVTDQMLERLYKKGHKDGGEIHHVPEIKKLDSIPKLAEGNLISNAMKGYSKSAEFLKNLGIAGYNEAKEEIPTLLHPRAIPDIVANVGAGIAGIPGDIMNAIIPPLNEEEVPNYKPALGSEDLQERLKQSGITTGTERPLIEGIATLASPRGIAKTGKEVLKHGARLVEEGRIPGLINPRNNILPEHGTNLGASFSNPSQDFIYSHKMESMPGNQWHSWIQSNAPKAAKKELETSGTLDMLKNTKDKLSKQDVMNHVRENEPRLRAKTYTQEYNHPYEVVGNDEDGWDVVDSSMGDRVINSHEDQGVAYMAADEIANETHPTVKYSKWTLPGDKEDYREIVIQDKPKLWSESSKFESSHYPEARNPIAHLRVNHREDIEGKPTLFIEEMQSDWGQTGKKYGFSTSEKLPDIDAGDLLAKYGDKLNSNQKDWLHRFTGRWESVMNDINLGFKPDSAMDDLHKEYTEWISKQKTGISPGPYVQDTKDWTALTLKQAIKEAVDNGKTQVAWTTGAQQADRYDLSKRLSSVSLHPREDGQLALNAYDHDGHRVIQELVTEDNLDDYLGKELAEKLINTPTGGTSNIRRLDGLDIKTEHKGMQGYYDKILPQVANDVIKQLGGKNKVKTIKISTGEPTYALRNKTTGSNIGGGYSYEEAKQAIKENPNREMYKVLGGDSEQLGFDITPDMLKFIKEDVGIPKHAKGGPIDLETEFKIRRRYG